jgi:hypothetical protein
VIFADRQGVECAVREWDSDCFRLCSVCLAAIPEKPAVNAGGRQSLIAELTSAIGVSERHDDKIALLHLSHVGPDGLDDADSLVTHSAASFGRRQVFVWP